VNGKVEITVLCIKTTDIQCVRKVALHLKKVVGSDVHERLYRPETVSRNFSISQRTALRWSTGVSGNFSANCYFTKSVYLLPSRKTFSTIKTRSSIERTTVSKNRIKQLHTLPVLHYSCCLTTEYSETTEHFNGNFDYRQPNLRTVA
jgi:hypothetical protein